MATVILDVGKSHSKLSAFDGGGGGPLKVSTYPNRVGLGMLDHQGIETWLLGALADFSRSCRIDAIVPVGHGAGAAYLLGDRLACPIRDYEAEPPRAIAISYEERRGPFTKTLSPRLPMGLNLGMQLYWQEAQAPFLKKAGICLWPQYWAWRLSGEHACEVSSLGCHTDLWHPIARQYSDLARQEHWDTRLGRITPASEVVGRIRRDLATVTGMPTDCEILCGVHDSNAALLSFSAGDHFTLVSTGTWFVAMRRGAIEIPELDETRDTLGNVDVEGRVVPSARFMGGREYEAIAGEALSVAPQIRDAAALITRGTLVRPSFVPDCGPYPRSPGKILGESAHHERPALASLYLALMTDVLLDLVGTSERIVLEGRFAVNPVFAGALAALRPEVCRSISADGVAQGAYRLRHPRTVAVPIEPCVALDADVPGYRDVWWRAVQEQECAMVRPT